MRYITLPARVEIPTIGRDVRQPDGSVVHQPIPLGLPELVGSFFVSNKAWKHGLDSRRALIELIGALKDREPGEVVAIEDSTVELIIRCDKEQQWPVVAELGVATLMLSVLSAPKEKPPATP